MAVEILPSTADGLETRLIRQRTPDSGRTETLVITGPKGAVEAQEEAYAALLLNSTVAGTNAEYSRGRGTLTVSYMRQPDNELDDSIQMLYMFDVVRDIFAAPYFASLSDANLCDVRNHYEAQTLGAAPAGWSNAQKYLYGHLLRGQSQYWDTAYEFRKAWVTSSQKELRAAANDVNTVVALPSLNSIMKRLIGDLPAGEWLKRPTTMQPIGKGLYQVETAYLWSVKWSVIYGGTFTGV